MPEPISVVLNVLNAQSTIANAIRSAKPWASEIIVVDQHRTRTSPAKLQNHSEPR